MSLIQFLNIQPTVDYSSATDPRALRGESRIDVAKESRRDSIDKFDRFVDESRDAGKSRNIDKTDKVEDTTLYVEDSQGEVIEIPLDQRQLQHLANLDRVALVDPDILEQFGGLSAFVDALKSLLSGNPTLSEDDLVSLPYQIEALSEEHFGSETFPHLIAANLSPAELNVLARQLEGRQGQVILSQINQQTLEQPVRVVMVSGLLGDNNRAVAELSFSQEELMALQQELSLSPDELSGEAISALQLLMAPTQIGTGKWFQRPAPIEGSVTLREVMESQVVSQGMPDQASLFGKIVSQFAQSKGDQTVGALPSVEGTLSFSNLDTDLNFTLSGNVLLYSPDDFLHTISAAPITDSAAQTAHAHGVLGSQQAGQTHQATQLVAAHIQKSAENGGAQKLSVLLNPPELGRVQIDVEMDSANKLKVHMVAEREAAYMLLQRDSSTLEQTLQNAGLDVDSGDIELSFAGDEFFFGQEDREQYADFGLQARGDASGEQGVEDIVETQPDIFRDPYTGMWHYNLLV